MALETKEEVLERILQQPRPKCPYCRTEMDIWETPPITFSDGLGWGTPYMYVCFNDECSAYQEGWDHLQEHYSQVASYRCAMYPDSLNIEYMPVFSKLGGKGQIINDEVLAHQEALKEAIKKGFSLLATCYTEKDWPTVLNMLFDPTEPVRVRIKAAEMVGDFGELESIEPLRSAKFGHTKLAEAVEASISRIHERFFTRECPFCAEIIKKRAKICKHCGKEVAGL